MAAHWFRVQPSNSLILLARASILGLPLAVIAAPTLAETHVVYVFDFGYSIQRPETGEFEDPLINVGDTVRWVWLNDFHDVVAVPGQAEEFQSELFFSGDIFEHTFSTPGVYWYYCTPHGSPNPDGTASGMAATVEVRQIPAPGVALMGLLGVAMASRRRR